jgi:arginase family enzyme
MTRAIVEELSWLLRPAGGGLYLVTTGSAEQRALQRRFYEAESDADVTQRFLQTLEDIQRARVVILGIPSDTGAGFRRGANLGPQAIRARLLDDDPEWVEHCRSRGIIDIGDVFVVPQLLDDEMHSEGQLVRSRDALYPDVAPERRRQLPVSPLSIGERALSLVLELAPQVKPLVLGGDHSCAWPVVKALHDRGRRFCIAQADAHTDLLSERLGVRMCFATWTFHANELVGRCQRVIQFGIRSTRYPKEYWEDRLGVRQFWADEIRAQPEAALDAIVAAVQATGLPVYLSNDIDGTDSSVADACGTPEPDGLDPDWVCALIERLGRDAELVGGDVMEVAPLLGTDSGRVTLQVAARYVRSTLDALIRPEPAATPSSHGEQHRVSVNFSGNATQ